MEHDAAQPLLAFGTKGVVSLVPLHVISPFDTVGGGVEDRGPIDRNRPSNPCRSGVAVGLGDDQERCTTQLVGRIDEHLAADRHEEAAGAVGSSHGDAVGPGPRQQIAELGEIGTCGAGVCAETTRETLDAVAE